MPTDRERLARVLGGEALAPLRVRLRRRFSLSRGGDELVLARLAPHERRALEGLLGLRARDASSLRVDLRELDAVLAGAGLAGSLREALELLDGPIPDLLAARAEQERAWQEVFARAGSPALQTHLAQAGARGLIERLSQTRVARAAELIAAAELVLARLPVQGMPRSQLAAEALGDAHGLDAGRPLATLMMALLRREEESERETWARMGVLINELASPALVLNLPAAPDTPVGTLVEAARTEGVPLHLSLRSLLRHQVRWQVAARDVFVCENANVVAIAADQLGATCAPLVCTDGMPSASQRTLLAQLADQGARLRYHGDFDWPGLRIANYVMRTFRAVPWRMSAGDYAGSRGRALAGTPVPASWDPHLAEAMLGAGYALDEESVALSLCADLAQASG